MVNKKIMIVEDDFIIRMFIEKVVLDSGYELVSRASSYEEAVELAEQFRPDLILMDIGLNGKKDGIETATRIRELLPVKIVYLTGNSDEKTMEHAKSTQPLGFIFKPIDEEMLKEVLQRFITQL
jgi:CheY-like chemotaxis protein